MIDFAYGRLQKNLSAISDSKRDVPVQRESITASFLDGWVIIDAIDRMRGLLRFLTDKDPSNPADIHRFLDESSGVRDIRNVTDHLAQRVDYVIANDSAALGILNWLTYRVGEKHATIYVLVPGTITNVETKQLNPYGKMVSPGVNHITLSAGEYSVNISEQVGKVINVVRYVEGVLIEFFSQNPEAVRLTGDLMISAEYHFEQSCE